jgi:protein-S-isoprenylcysteine O-methyltransferase Ste14
MKKLVIFAYGVASYLVFLATFAYLAGFMGNLWVPKSIDAVPTAPIGQALLINLCLLAVFAVQHSVMARGFFKRWLTRFIPAAAERSTYVLASSLALILLMALWEPMGGVVWDVQEPMAHAAIHVAYGLGFALILVSTFLINHFDLFGLRQVWLNLVGREYEPLQFKLHTLYRYVRHPLYVGFFIVLWATPTMTLAHLVFSIMCSGYILVGTRLEERDLRRFHPEYEAYARAVPGFVPRLRRKHPATAAGLG